MTRTDFNAAIDEFIELAEWMAKFPLRTKVVTVWGDPVVRLGPPIIDEAASRREKRIVMHAGTIDDVTLPLPPSWAALLYILKDAKAALKLTDGFPPGFAEKLRQKEATL